MMDVEAPAVAVEMERSAMSLENASPVAYLIAAAGNVEMTDVVTYVVCG